jgi:hypothetical protein
MLALILCGARLAWAQCPSCAPKIASAQPPDWTTHASTYTHDRDGRRVDQYAVHVEPYAIERLDYNQSGFRHTRSTLQAGTSVDNFHVVERWGGPVQPYGEWRYPYRPFASPYGAWGPQPPVVNAQGGVGLPGSWGLPFGYGAGGFGVGPQWSNGFGVGPNNALRPEQDDYYAPAPEPAQQSDRDFFYPSRRP